LMVREERQPEQQRDSALPEWSDSRPCVNFVNTVDPRIGPDPRELLPGYGALLTWAHRTGVLDEREVREAHAAAEKAPQRASRCHQEVIRVRETLYGVLRALAEGRDPDPRDAHALQDAATDLFRQRVLRWDGTRWQWSWRRTDPLLLPLLRVLDDAVALLTADADPHLGMCAAEQCGWLFTDTSKSGTKRWCNMRTCGNRAKARRHLQRRKRPGTG
jgi:predicted RNA-binding Zn ribbon-like protein